MFQKRPLTDTERTEHLKQIESSVRWLSEWKKSHSASWTSKEELIYLEMAELLLSWKKAVIKCQRGRAEEAAFKLPDYVWRLCKLHGLKP